MVDAGWKPHGKRFKKGKDAPMVLDIETHGTRRCSARCPAAGAPLRGGVRRHGLRATGRAVMTYVSPGFMPELGNQAPEHGEDVWVAAFRSPREAADARGVPAEPRARAPVLGAGTFPGVGATVDLDVWLGDAKSLQPWIEGGRWRPPPARPSAEPAMSTSEAQKLLRQIGWPIKVGGSRGPKTAQAIKDFQRGYLGDPPRPRCCQDWSTSKTEDALRLSAANGGRLGALQVQGVRLLAHRAGSAPTGSSSPGSRSCAPQVGRPIGILSGFRDFNLGASMSQHRFGNAIDPTSRSRTSRRSRRSRSSRASATSPGNGLVRHVDVRHVGPNTTGGTKARPTIFVDAF